MSRQSEAVRGLRALRSLIDGKPFQDMLSFQELQQVVGFPEYDNELQRIEEDKAS